METTSVPAYAPPIEKSANTCIKVANSAMDARKAKRSKPLEHPMGKNTTKIAKSGLVRIDTGRNKAMKSPNNMAIESHMETSNNTTAKESNSSDAPPGNNKPNSSGTEDASKTPARNANRTRERRAKRNISRANANWYSMAANSTGNGKG